jgi:hypothetical protein
MSATAGRHATWCTLKMVARTAHLHTKARTHRGQMQRLQKERIIGYSLDEKFLLFTGQEMKLIKVTV